MPLEKSWSAILLIESDRKSPLMASLATEAEIEIIPNNPDKVRLTFCEGSAADLRAIWNTRLRSLIASLNVLQVLE